MPIYMDRHDNKEATAKSVVKTQQQKEEEAFLKMVKDCEGKSEGDTCGTKQMCGKLDDILVCTPECVYYADKEQQGLTKEYDCVRPESMCKEGSKKDFRKDLHSPT